MADDGQRQRHRPRGARRIPPQQRDAKFGLIGGEPRREGREPGIRRVRGRRYGQQIAERCRPHGGEIGEVHPQQLAGDAVGGVIGQVMHARDHGIRRHHQRAARRWDEHGGVIFQVERPWTRQRPEMPADEVEFGRQSRHPKRP
jgi:hypothetical protein